MIAPRGVRRQDHRDETHFLSAGDGVALTLIHVRGSREPRKRPVLLVHGVAMRAESFRPPGVRSLVDVLLTEGWDVWMLNWRGSTDLDPLPWTLDDVAAHDLPAAVRHIVAETGASNAAIIAHCAGAASASMAVTAGLLPEVDRVVANGVSLHPVIPGFARAKLHLLRPLLGGGQPYVDLAWGDGPASGVPWLARAAVRAFHAECRNPSCNMASFALGAGHPALWRHENLDAATHRWLGGELGKVPLSFYAQMAASDRARQFVSMRAANGLPHRAAAQPPRSDARFVLLTGDRNRAYLPASQQTTQQFLNRHQPGRHALVTIPGYSHADVFVGRRAHVDVFPRIVHALTR